MRVTGGAKGRGEQTRSFNTDVKYTPKVRTIKSLSRIRRREDEEKISCAYPRPISSYPKKKKIGRNVIKNVCVPRVDVYTKYVSSHGVRMDFC